MVKNAITVFARVKPERSRTGLVSYKIYRRPKRHSDEDFLVLTAPQKFADYIDNRPESWNFSFSRIFEHDVSQDDVFDSVARPVVNRVFEGYNATIFAYGQTGSGKTYAITGEPGVRSQQGILPRTLQYVFDVVRKNPENLYSVEVAYLEIYNENGYDLLERKQREAAGRLDDLPRVTIQEDENGAMHLKNLSFRVVENAKEALQFLADGDTYRAISETPMNPRSSRSHCIFTIVVAVKKIGEDRYRRAKMHLVDLAGSERVYKCSIQGTILTEAKHINLSLHFLEQVIVSLGQDNVSHVPYRNSLLTSILRDSLGGNCLTTMLATLSVSTFNLEETISTCRFAQRVAIVKNDVNLTFELDTKSENKLLRMENERLRKQIEDLTKQESSSSTALTGSLEYYRNLVVQRDQEISRLIEILRKERAKKPSTQEGPFRDLSEATRHQEAAQISSRRVSPRSVYQGSPTMLKKRRQGNSLQRKARLSPRREESASPKTSRKIQPSKWRTRSTVPEVPDLVLKENWDGIDVGVIRASEDDSNVEWCIGAETDVRETVVSEKNGLMSQEINIEDSRIKDHEESTKTPDNRPDLKMLYRNDTEKVWRESIVAESDRSQNNQKSNNFPNHQSDSNIAYGNDFNYLTETPVSCGEAVISVNEKRQDTQELIIEDSKISDNEKSKKHPASQSDSSIAYRSDTKAGRNQTLVSDTLRQNSQTFNIEKSPPNETESIIMKTVDLPSPLEVSLGSPDVSKHREMINAETVEDTQATNQEPLINTKDYLTTESGVSKKDKPPDEKPARDKSPLLDFSRTVIKMLKSPRYRRNEDGDETSGTKSGTPRSSFKTPSIIRNMLCKDKTSPRDPRNPIANQKPNEPSGTSRDPNISNSLKKSLPLTGDPEIDEEIIAFYKAKRSGGTY